MREPETSTSSGNSAPSPRPWFRRTIALGTAGTAVITVAGLLGSILESRALGVIPPSFVLGPSTALCFLFLSATLVGHDRRRGTSVWRAAVAALVVVVGLLALIGGLFGLELTGEGQWLGGMSLATASGFVMAGASALLVCVRSSRRGDAAASLGLLTALLGATMLLDFLFGTAVMDSGVPMTVTTSVGFLFLGAALTAAAGADSFPTRLVVGDSLAAVLSRGFLALTASSLLVQGLVLHWQSYSASSDALVTSLLIIGGSAVTGAAVASVSRWFGERLEESKRKLQASKELHRTILMTAIDGFWLADREGRLLEVNESYCRMSGYSTQELLAMRISDLEAAETAIDTAAHIRDLIARGEGRFESRHRRKDGSTFDVAISTQYRGGRFAVFVEDLSARRQAEAALRQLEGQVRSMLESISLIGVILDRKGCVVFCNDYLLSVTGWTHEEVIGRNWFDIFLPPNVRDEVNAVFLAAIDEGKIPAHFENEIVTRDGERKLIRWSTSILRDVTGAVEGVASIGEDVSAHRQAEEALKESEFFFRESQRAAKIGSYRVDFKTGFWKSSEVLDTIFGIDASYVRSVSGWIELVHPDDNAMMMQHLQDDVLGKGLGFDMEYRIVRKTDGSVRWVHGLGALSFDEDGAVGSMMGTIQDVTQRKEAVEALRLRMGELSTLLEVSRSFSATLDLRQIMQTITDRVAELTPMKKAAVYLLEGEWLRLWAAAPPLPAQYPEELRNAFVAEHPHIREAITTRKPVFLQDAATAELTPAEHTATVLRGLHSILYLPLVVDADVLGVLIVSSGDKPRALSSMNADFYQTLANVAAMAIENGTLYAASERHGVELEQEIVERKRTEEALRESKRRLKDLTFSIGDWVWEVNEHGTYTYSSLRGEEIFGDVIGKTPFDLMSPDEATRVAPIFSDLVGRIAPIKDLENWNLTKSGERVCLLTNGVPILDAAGTFKGYRGVDKDITHRKRAELEKERLNAELQQAQKMELVGRLAGGVAHDFNNMLLVIQGAVELIQDRLDIANPLHADLEVIMGASLRSVELTRQLLTFARKQTVSPKVLDLNQTVEGMLRLLQRLIGEAIDLRWNPAPDLWSLKIDPSQVDQLLANLCVNARDAISGTGKLTIETGHRTVTLADCAAHPGFVPGEYVLLRVSDDGAGMDTETLSHLFEPFFTTKTKGKGTGLGLAMVYGIVHQNHGFIEVCSELEHGTTFNVYLPRYTGATEEARVDAPRRTAARGHETILIAEDESSILTLAARWLEQQGYVVLCANTPSDALRLASEHASELHLLLADVVMPEMSGRDLARSLLSLNPHLKCLFMSGHTADVISQHGLLDDDAHFLWKPFSRDALAAKVRAVLDGVGGE